MVPHLFWISPFVILLLCIAALPVMRRTEHWWHDNTHKLLVSAALGWVTVLYYWMRSFGFTHAGHVLEPGWPTVLAMLDHALVRDYIPFMVMLFSLYTISGGIRISGSFLPRPLVNTVILAIGGLIASFVGTTGASVLLIRPLLEINRERRFKAHTVVFFIFIVSNIGGCLLPIGDPPLFLGYLRGVPFLWTFSLTVEWAFCLVILLMVYLIWDMALFRKEDQSGWRSGEGPQSPFRIEGKRNLLLLYAVVAAIGILVPGKSLFPFGWRVPGWPLLGVREFVQLILAGISLLITPRGIRSANGFNFFPIQEVAALFVGLFVTMQAPVEILNLRGADLGLSTPWHFFWATGILSSFLDNAPTYVVFFQTAGALPWPHPNEMLLGVETATGAIAAPLLSSISCGAVFMGAVTYIGNAPNFMVKSIAEHSGVRMPSFFGYLAYSLGVLIPLFILVALLFHS